MPYTVRPDLLGIAFQMMGVLLVLGALRDGRRSSGPFVAAFAMFALAFCIKQTFVVPAAISLGLMLRARKSGCVPLKTIERGLLLALAIVLAVYATEELMTSGRMSQAVFRAAHSVADVHPGTWSWVLIVFVATVAGSGGALSLLATTGFVAIRPLRRPGPWFLRAAGASLIGAVVLLMFVQVAINSVRLSVAILFTLAIVGVCWCAAGFYRGWQETIGGSLDGVLWLYLATETTLVLVLSRGSTGAWVNYAIQAVVFLAVLTARALGRPVQMNTPFRWKALIAAVALVCLAGAITAVRTAERKRRINREAIATLLRENRCAPSSVFVVNHPGMNRLHGRLDLVYDEWLYPVFEVMGLAQPRAIWLHRILTSGTIQFVVNTSEAARLEGIPQTLPQIGYVPKYQVGPFYIWERRIEARP
jgi:hypothetical protein